MNLLDKGIGRVQSPTEQFLCNKFVRGRFEKLQEKLCDLFEEWCA
jgi:hypothetical protein